jgi:hypothetical protein
MHADKTWGIAEPLPFDSSVLAQSAAPAQSGQTTTCSIIRKFDCPGRISW